MGHERLKHMKENLLTCIESQMYDLHNADAQELGEAIDMLKDLEEAIYYCTITEAMEESGGNHNKKHGYDNYEWTAQGVGDYERSYYDGRQTHHTEPTH
jgi:hypothetical protein